MTSVADHLTFPWDGPQVQLDHILAKPALRARTSVRRLPVSDHLALIADLEV
jgi:endonuclease/exonuclease/phosphatase family metal-dependent hydrolase